MSEDDLCLIREESKMQWPFSNRERLYLYERQMTREGELLYTCKSCTSQLCPEVSAITLSPRPRPPAVRACACACVRAAVDTRPV